MPRERYKSVVEKPLSKDLVFKKVSGVCAGIAKHYKVPRIIVRIAAIVSLFMFPVVTAISYLVATILLPARSV